jgi:hypothetical protein
MADGKGFEHVHEIAYRKLGCPQCGSKFDTPAALNQHITDKHKSKLVPIVPTKEMLQAGYDAYKREYMDGGNSDDIWSRTWDAMLNASPTGGTE